MDAAEAIRRVTQALPSLVLVSSTALQEKIALIWLKALTQSRWPSLEDAAFNPMLGAKPSLVEHVNAVTEGSVAVARVFERLHGLTIDYDCLLVGSLLHDVSKLLEYEPDASGKPLKSELGHLVPHATYGAHLAWEAGIPLNAIHLILSHTEQNRLLPHSNEALILRYVDYGSADVLRLRQGAPLLMQP